MAALTELSAASNRIRPECHTLSAFRCGSMCPDAIDYTKIFTVQMLVIEYSSIIIWVYRNDSILSHELVQYPYLPNGYTKQLERHQIWPEAKLCYKLLLCLFPHPDSPFSFYCEAYLLELLKILGHKGSHHTTIIY